MTSYISRTVIGRILVCHKNAREILCNKMARWKCLFCGFVTLVFSILLTHYNSNEHDTACKTVAIPCGIGYCTKSFTKGNSFAKHVRTSHRNHLHCSPTCDQHGIHTGTFENNIYYLNGTQWWWKIKCSLRGGAVLCGRDAPGCPTLFCHPCTKMLRFFRSEGKLQNLDLNYTRNDSIFFL